MRLFLAIAPPDELLERVLELQTELRSHIERQGVRFVKRAKVHLTLAFLGDDSEPSGVVSLASPVLANAGPLHLKTAGIGCFPDARRPKTIWLGVEGAGMTLLASGIRTAFDLESERATPHIALAKISPPSQAVGRLLGSLLATPLESSACVANEVCLVKTLPDGEFETVHRFFL